MKYMYDAIIILFILSIQSCITKYLETTESSLLGNWIEEYPVCGRTELIFKKEKQMIKKTATLPGFSDPYTYRILNDTIELSSNIADEYTSTKVFFKVTGNEVLIGDFPHKTSNEILRLKKK